MSNSLETSAVALSSQDPHYDLMTAVSQPCATDISEVEGTVAEGEGPYIFQYVRRSFSDSIKGDTPRYRLTVPTADGDRQFLVGKPLIDTLGVTGRATRGFVAWDVAGERFVSLKDAWRPTCEDVHKEGKTLRDMKEQNVRNIPTYVCDGELQHHSTTPTNARMAAPAQADAPKGQTKPKGRKRTRDDTAQAPSQTRSLPQNGKHTARPLRHYRLVIQEVCLSLTEFKTGEQLLSLVRDCIHAHQDAVTKCNVHHRNISAGNVLICPTVVLCPDGKRRVVWKGILTDWEMSEPIEDPEPQPTARQRNRTANGTWQFAAVRLLDKPSAPVTTADELESFFHIVLYNALRYLRSNCSSVSCAMYELFENYDSNGVGYRCSLGRRITIQHGKLVEVCGSSYHFLDDDGLGRHPINCFIHIMLAWFRARYAKLNALDPAMSPTLIEQWTGNIKDNLALLRSVKAGGAKAWQPPSQAEHPDATKLDTHDMILQLLDTLLDRAEWPKDDKLGDLLEQSRLALPHSMDTSWLQAEDADTEDEDSDEERPEPKRRRSRKNAAAQTRESRKAVPVMSEEEEDADQVLVVVPVGLGEDSQPPKFPPPPRTRGRRPTRPFGRNPGGCSRRRT
ncbi:hypothetical protein C8Q80DRAFT_1276043 [Daedaleopsis nitida]|nr:hypothetical protein C8Q80DRAFT_1276043 [Daedaleopsis nitida]